MLCTRCQRFWSETGRRRRVPVFSAAEQIGPLGSLYCVGCGSSLPLQDGTDSLLRKLSQLAQFGLSAGDRPILSADDPDVATAVDGGGDFATQSESD